MGVSGRLPSIWGADGDEPVKPGDPFSVDSSARPVHTLHSVSYLSLRGKQWPRPRLQTFKDIPAAHLFLKVGFWTETCLSCATVASLWRGDDANSQKKGCFFWPSDLEKLVLNASSRQAAVMCGSTGFCEWLSEYTPVNPPPERQWEEREEWHRYTGYSRWVWRGRRWREETLRAAWQHRPYKGTPSRQPQFSSPATQQQQQQPCSASSDYRASSPSIKCPK